MFYNDVNQPNLLPARCTEHKQHEYFCVHLVVTTVEIRVSQRTAGVEILTRSHASHRCRDEKRMSVLPALSTFERSKEGEAC
eukprot:1466800-Amphidinium_carterae.1